MKTKDLITFGCFVVFAVLSGAVIANPAALGGLFRQVVCDVAEIVAAKRFGPITATTARRTSLDRRAPASSQDDR